MSERVGPPFGVCVCVLEHHLIPHLAECKVLTYATTLLHSITLTCNLQTLDVFPPLKGASRIRRELLRVSGMLSPPRACWQERAPSCLDAVSGTSGSSSFLSRFSTKWFGPLYIMFECLKSLVFLPALSPTEPCGIHADPMPFTHP